MPSHALLLPLLLWVPRTACFHHHDAVRWKLQHHLLADSALCGNTETAVPLSLLQVNAEGKRSNAAGKANAHADAPNRTDARGPAATLAAPRLPSRRSIPLLAEQQQLRWQQQQQEHPQLPLPQTQQQQQSLPLTAAQRSGEANKAIAALQAARTTTSNEGDAIQGLVFSVIVLIIVAGFYLLVVREFHPGGDFENTLRADGSIKRPPHPLGSRSAPPPFGQSLLPRRTAASGGLPSGPLLDPRASMGRRPEVEEWNAELPMIYPQLVMPVAHTRLAVPVEPLGRPQFEVDVLGLSGVPLLSAALVEGSGARDVQISLHSVSTLIAVVTSAMEILGADGTHFGRLVKESGPGESPKYVLQDRAARQTLILTSQQPGSHDFKLTSVSGGRAVERATTVRRPKGKLPAEHYEIVANPNVDAVLVLGCFLAVVVFDPVSSLTGSMFRLPDVQAGRPSTGPRLESQSLVGFYDGGRT